MKKKIQTKEQQPKLARIRRGEKNVCRILIDHDAPSIDLPDRSIMRAREIFALQEIFAVQKKHGRER